MIPRTFPERSDIHIAMGDQQRAPILMHPHGVDGDRSKFIFNLYATRADPLKRHLYTMDLCVCLQTNISSHYHSELTHVTANDTHVYLCHDLIHAAARVVN